MQLKITLDELEKIVEEVETHYYNGRGSKHILVNFKSGKIQQPSFIIGKEPYELLYGEKVD
jgi:hypothetical protein